MHRVCIGSGLSHRPHLSFLCISHIRHLGQVCLWREALRILTLSHRLSELIPPSTISVWPINPFPKICKIGRDGVKIEHFSKALFYSSRNPSCFKGQFNGGEGLPQVPQASWGLAPGQGSQRGGFYKELFSALGSVVFFIPGKETACPSAAQLRTPSKRTGPGGVRQAALPLERMSPRLMTRWSLQRLYQKLLIMLLSREK